MIVYRLRYKDAKIWEWRSDDQNTYFQKDKMSKNTGIIYLTEEAAKRAKSSVYGGDEMDIVAFEMTEV